MAAEAFAPAKINLTLHVTGRRADGYHLLDSLVVFADLGDRVCVEPSADWSLDVTGPFAADVPRDDTNLALRAARFSGGAPVAITLDKHLPVASGIGGGSADAAATLRALSALDGRAIPGDLTVLGADVPVCLSGQPCRMIGIGERLERIPDLPPLYGVLVNPGVAMSTADVFRGLTAGPGQAMPATLPDWASADALADWLRKQRNDLELSARAMAPVIGVVLSRLAATPGCLLARMSGSGATCFGLYATGTEADFAARDLRVAHPGWWIAPVALGAGRA